MSMKSALERMAIETPRTEACIDAVMAKHPGESARELAVYFEEVHQELAPLCRQLERENQAMREVLDRHGLFAAVAQ